MANTQKQSIGLLGGSFDPAHKGHLGISKIVIQKLKLKRIYWVITRKNPFKNKTFYSLKERIKFAKKIAKTEKKIKLIYLENIIKSSRTIDVINFFIKKKKIKNIYFIIGSDNLARFHKWKSWKKILKLVKLIVFSRRGYDRKGMKSTVVKNFKNRIIFIKNKPIFISSTLLKKRSKLST
ncbi:nicotinate (nicotinamide) nucleotide adenylyltransferase [Candidatus Pelagibacter bacterium]|nr:nicotinate (nicotinamide) nucleotide adenylyltransferase [Candidatus Pelagibacter bacterium]